MKITQAEIILNVLAEATQPVPSYNLIKANTKWGWLGSGSDRIARSLAEAGKIERHRNGKYSYYSLKKTLF